MQDDIRLKVTPSPTELVTDESSSEPTYNRSSFKNWREEDNSGPNVLKSRSNTSLKYVVDQRLARGQQQLLADEIQHLIIVLACKQYLENQRFNLSETMANLLFSNENLSKLNYMIEILNNKKNRLNLIKNLFNDVSTKYFDTTKYTYIVDEMIENVVFLNQVLTSFLDVDNPIIRDPDLQLTIPKQHLLRKLCWECFVSVELANSQFCKMNLSFIKNRLTVEKFERGNLFQTYIRIKLLEKSKEKLRFIYEKRKKVLHYISFNSKQRLERNYGNRLFLLETRLDDFYIKLINNLINYKTSINFRTSTESNNSSKSSSGSDYLSKHKRMLYSGDSSRNSSPIPFTSYSLSPKRSNFVLPMEILSLESPSQTNKPFGYSRPLKRELSSSLESGLQGSHDTERVPKSILKRRKSDTQLKEDDSSLIQLQKTNSDTNLSNQRTGEEYGQVFSQVEVEYDTDFDKDVEIDNRNEDDTECLYDMNENESNRTSLDKLSDLENI